MDEHGIGTYPVGVLAALLQRGAGGRWSQLKYEFRYQLHQARAGNWRAVRNSWNGFLAEWHYPPAGVEHSRCGTGWTRKAARRSLSRHLVADNLSAQERAR